MQTILILLVNTFVLGTAQIVYQEDFYNSLVDLPVQKRDEPGYICKDSPLDIVLVIDSSLSITGKNFEKQIDFLVEFVALFDIQPSKVRFAALSYATVVIRKGAFNFNKYNTTEAVQWGLRRMQYDSNTIGETTNTHLALKYARRNFFRRARPEANKLCIVLTDGMSTEPYETEAEVDLMKNGNVTMVAIGVGGEFSLKELNTIATSPDLVITVEKHSLLETIQKKLIMKTCTDVEFFTTETPQRDRDESTVTPTTHKDEDITKAPPPAPNKEVITKAPLPGPNNEVTTKVPTTQTDGDCNGPLDINFIFNPSVIGTRRVVMFIENTVTSKALANDDVRVGIITVPPPIITGFRLNQYKTKKKMKNHFQAYKTNQMAAQVKDLRVKAFLPINGGRSKARRIGLIFLRGRLDDPYATVVEATMAKSDGIEIFVVVLGGADDKLLIDLIASGKSHVIHADNTIDFLSLSEQFMKYICKD